MELARIRVVDYGPTTTRIYPQIPSGKGLRGQKRETKHLGPIVRWELGAVCMARAGTIMKQVNCAAQGQMSHLGCGFL